MNSNFITHFSQIYPNCENQIIFLDRKGNYTYHSYQQLWGDSLSLATTLNQLGSFVGQNILIVHPTSYEFLKCFIAAQMTGATVISIYPPSSIENKIAWKQKSIEILGSQEINFVCASDELTILLRESDFFKTSVFLSEADQSRVESPYKIKEAELSKDLISFLQFSSGTTGAPKAIAISHKALMSNIEAIHSGLGEYKESVRCVSWLPLYHDMGLVGALLGALACGGEITLIQPEDFVRKPHLWLKAISDRKANITVAPNFAYGLVSKRITDKNLAGIDLSSLKIALCGAEMVNHATLSRFSEKFKNNGLSSNCILPVYGMAEATLAISFSELQKEYKFTVFDKEELREGRAVESKTGVDLCSVGSALPETQIKILDPAGNALESNLVGEVAFKSPSLFSGHMSKDGLKPVELNHGLYRTGDLGFFHKDHLYICGRLKEMMIIRGKNYLPTFFEEKIQTLEGIRKGKVVAFSSNQTDSETEQIYILAEHSKRLSESKKDLIKTNINKILSDEGLKAEEVTLLAPGLLPRTTSGKLQRLKAKEMFFNSGFTTETLLSRFKNLF